MVDTTQPWLEDLSEEWVPQATPDTIARNLESSPATQTSQSVPPKARSRLPRMRQSSGSFSEIQVRSIAKELRPSKQRSALAERSLSDNNIPLTSSPIASHIAPSPSAAYSFSSTFQGSVVYNGTVAHNTVAKSPTKEKGPHDTPEWRRRLVKGEIGYGDQKDLFGPTGLENIFQKPVGTSSEDTQQPKRKLGLLKGLAAMPSSPPPWPAAGQGEAYDEQPEIQVTNSGNDTQNSRQDSPRDGTVHEQEESITTQAPRTTDQEGPRTVSGQIEFENESFSPVYLTTNLKIGQLPTATPNFRGSELANRLRQIGSPPPTIYNPAVDESALSQPREDSSFTRLHDDSLPEGLPAGTPDLADVGRFVEFRRGGYSRDGSFRTRPLSPSPGRIAASSTSNGVPAAGNDKVDPSQGLSADEAANPQTPRRQANNQFLSPERAKNSGSPLKLFDAHDTFTSNRLQRRLSQLEYKSDKTASSSVKESKVEMVKVVQKTSRLTSVEEISFQNGGQQTTAECPPQGAHRADTFGRGQLNEYQFSGDFTVLSSDFDTQDDSAPDGSPSMDVAPPGSRQPLTFHLDGSPTSREPSMARRQGSGSVANPFRSVSRPKFHPHRKSSTPKLQEQPEVVHEYVDGKRGPTSPFKNPTPKRRRTIQSIDEDEDDRDEEDVFSDHGLGTVHHSHAVIQSIVGRKRQDARHVSSNNVANPETLARRHILRPRNPTPSQRRRDEIHAEIMEATEAFILSSPKLNTIREHVEPSITADPQSEQARAVVVAKEVAAFSIKKQHAMREQIRKRSVTTQDFLDEALKIMDFIRTKGRPTSGLGSLEETEAESELVEESVEHLSSSLTFERPPSREGRLSAWAEPNKHQLDPNVMSHLRKYQEKETDTFLNSSVTSLRFARISGSANPEGESVVIEQDDIRITDNPNRYSRTIDGEDISSQPRTCGTQHSMGSSLGHTIATNASRRSDHVATLAPEAVAHLIPHEVAGMSFDREKNIWVRQKSPSKEHRCEENREEEDQSGMLESEEDPLGNIPDLTVDEMNEQEVKTGSPARPQPTSETILEETEDGVQEEEEERPVTREGHGTAYTDVSSAPSKASNFGWSYPKTETRATSWSTQGPRKWSTQKTAHVQTTYAIPESDEDDIEHEIKYFEGRDHAPPNVRHPRVRDITISFAERKARESERQPAATPQKFGQSQWIESNAQQKSHRKQSSREQMHVAKALPHAQSSRIPKFTGEGDLSLLEDAPSKNYRMQLAMSVSAPVLGLGKKDVLATAPSSPVKGDLTFMLSDLPEFTLHQVDECELPDRMIVKHDGTRFSKALEDRYAQSTADLVKALQDVEPDEPFWEDLRQVDLHGNALSSLHRLDELCYQLEELNVSDNQISQVKGIPYSMRRLRAQNNCLTGLTSWTTLTNLQHLDISSNDIDCLDGLAELVHLRVLKVDDNKIKSLNGILHLDGLMELSAGGNNIEMVDFGRANMKSLTDLDLRRNRLFEVRNLHCLAQLQHLNLDDNEIEEFPFFDVPAKPCSSLRSIRLCRNGTALLDVDRHFPKLESLYVDGNSLTQVSGLEHLRYLRTFSAREQVLGTDSDTEICVSNLVRNSEIRSLYLSLNPTHGLDLSQHLHSLQRLELASMGLKELPNNFGQLTPNIRSINLNFNSIKDLRPLLNIKRLSELLLAGNKLERLRANAMVLGKLETLTRLDWRDNPLTLRFYAPASENRVMSLRQKPSKEQLTDRFVLPNGDVEGDSQHLSRLDYETRIRRRVTEMMLANFCKNLRELDGLPFDKARVLVKDDVWERLMFLGIIQRKQPEKADEKTG
ncbi:uncharacterized protein K460DRAFT_321940 [Cucurbitaria berberidis CBS 394.84]|uniref:Septation initiation network scaffold protein cdc11 n=1 Tax=Cucurbitaria berberidis CBS 394.84 TaxID=1168544 RepID=A0A9P4L455_9PLEO|nr:uncharacterized protein K460DRAFT_321940 [Cucurbitaria berberidis CBS 394.84]KAF1841100.1 hypothetical protein K460DRAFT_321940 [Cucurbitaria berberidis CBS 394.84]